MKVNLLGLLFISISVIATPISLSVKNAPTPELLTYLAQSLDKNIIIDEKISGNTTLRVENKNFDQLLAMIAKTQKIKVEKQQDIYSLGLKEDNEKINPLSVNKKPKLITKAIKLDYAKASEVIESLTKGSGNFLTENGYIYFDERSNRLLIKDTPQSLKEITALVQQLDQPTEQIAIEARIVTISSENLQALGVRWGMFTPAEGSRQFAGSLEGNGFTNNNLNVNFPVNNAASAMLQIATINSRVLDLELTALEQENNVEIIASPRLLTTNKKQASIKQGTEIPYAIYNKKDDLKEIQFREAVLGLEVTPHLAKNNQILLDLVVSQNSPAPNQTNNMLAIDKQEINTQVLAKHGETIVLGGIFQHLVAKGEDRVPILGSVPVIKRLFSRDKEQISKRELVIFVTPYRVKSSPISTSSPKTKKSPQN